MRIAVISPHASNTGNTTLAMMIGLELSSAGKKTCITHTKPISKSFYSYLNFTGFQDKTSTSSQIVKILKEGGLNGDEVRDYCKQITDDLEAFTNEATNFTQEDMEFMVNYIARSFPHEHIIFDVDDNYGEKMGDLIKLCDVVVLNITQSVAELKEFYKNKDTYMKAIGKKPLVVVVNRYNSIKGTLKETANWMGVKKPNNWLVLHENPWISWATNHGQLNQLFRKVKAKDPRVVEISSDISKIGITLAKAKVSKDKKAGGR